jgi:hypothetical protein
MEIQPTTRLPPQLVLRIKRKDEVFFDTYTNARTILDLGSRKKVPEDEVIE